MKFTHELRQIKRSIILDEGYENDTEHSYQLAMTAWYLIADNGLLLDLQKCIAMALVHEMVEVHAGDVKVFGPAKGKSDKERKEKIAAEQLKKDWPSLELAHELIGEYKECASAEAKFVYALDKLLPEINNYLYDGKAWREEGISFEMVRVIKAGKVDRDPLIGKYHQELLKIFEENLGLFGKPANG